MVEKKAYPGIGHSFLLLVLFVILQALFFVPFFIIDSVLGSNLIRHPVSQGIINLLSIGLILLLGKIINKTPAKQLYPIKPIKLIYLLPILLTTIGLSIVLSDVDNLFRMIVPMPEEIIEFFINMFAGSTSFWGTFFTIVIVASLSEELMFRGLIFQGYLNRYGAIKAIIFSALLFSIFHFNPWQFIGAFIFGVVFAWWFIMTRNLTICIIGHALNNFMPLLVSRILKLSIQGYTVEYASQTVLQPLWFDMLGIVLLVSGVWFSIRVFGSQVVLSIADN